MAVAVGIGERVHADSVPAALGARPGAQFVRWEASSASGFPDHETWQTPKTGSGFNTPGTIADLDGDDIPELVTADNTTGSGSKLQVYEAAASDGLVLRFETPVPYQLAIVAADFDQDGRNEFASVDLNSQLTVFEGVANDTIVPTQSIATGHFGAWSLVCVETGSPDGRPMLFSPGQENDTTFHVKVFESLADDTLSQVNQTTIVIGGLGCIPELQIAASDLVGSSTPEIVLSRLCNSPTHVYSLGSGGALTPIARPPYSGFRVNATSKTATRSGSIALSQFIQAGSQYRTLILQAQ